MSSLRSSVELLMNETQPEQTKPTPTPSMENSTAMSSPLPAQLPQQVFKNLKNDSDVQADDFYYYGDDEDDTYMANINATDDARAFEELGKQKDKNQPSSLPTSFPTSSPVVPPPMQYLKITNCNIGIYICMYVCVI